MKLQLPRETGAVVLLDPEELHRTLVKAGVPRPQRGARERDHRAAEPESGPKPAGHPAPCAATPRAARPQRRSSCRSVRCGRPSPVQVCFPTARRWPSNPGRRRERKPIRSVGGGGAAADRGGRPSTVPGRPAIRYDCLRARVCGPGLATPSSRQSLQAGPGMMRRMNRSNEGTVKAVSPRAALQIIPFAIN